MIGGFSLAAHWMGWETVAFVERDEFCQKVLAKNFKDVPIYGDITTFSGEPFRGQCSIVTGGFPCQPFSVAGQKKGRGDDRFLWDETLRIIEEVRPYWFVGENVIGIEQLAQPEMYSTLESEGVGTTTENFILPEILESLEGVGYEVQVFVIPACATNAEHRRDRVWICANSGSERLHKRPVRQGNDAKNYVRIDGAFRELLASEEFRNLSKTGNQRSLDGVSHRMDRPSTDEERRLKAVGNTIVPQVAYEIFKAIEKTL